MDESWRMRMGLPSLATRRRASEDLTSRTTARESGRSSFPFPGSVSDTIDVEDFNDVFGGPPKSVLNRKLSCDFSGHDYFYRDIFRRQEEKAERSNRNGRRLPEFRIPSSHGTDEKSRFYNDKFGSSSNCRNDDDRKEKKSSSSSKMWRSFTKSKWTSKSKSKSKSNSSSVLSYEEISPNTIEPSIREEDVGLSSFASKLRPINVPYRWNSSSANNQASEVQFQYNNASYIIDDHTGDQHFMRCSNPDFSQHFPSPEADNPNSNTVGISIDDVNELESPSSANSMFFHNPEASMAKFRFNQAYEQQNEDLEEDEDFNSYVIEINSGRREVINEAADIDEAIAWAKGTFQGCSSSSGELNMRLHESNCQFGEERSMIPLVMEVPQNFSERYTMLGTSELDERINSWSAGNNTNIRLLLSTLHHVLWASSGWNAIPLSNLMEYSQIKKAYQKARLCIHPDKLQQRGATPRQKYVAENAFSVLQNAWDSFISQETSFS